MIKIAPSLLSADWLRLGEEIAAVTRAGADFIHVDVMDGLFVPNITCGPVLVAAARKATSLPLDVHLMIEDPGRYVADFVKAGADWLTVHPETTPHLNRVLNQIREAGAKAGVVLNPATPLNVLDYVTDLLDMVLVMGVNPGFSGQAYIAGTTAKVAELKAYLDQRGAAEVLIEVDGGVTGWNAAALAAAGARILVSGSHLFKSADYQTVIKSLKGL